MIFIIGHHGSGKNTAADLFLSDFNVLNIDVTAALKKDKKRNFPDLNIPEWVKHVISTYGMGYFLEVANKATISEVENANKAGKQFDDIIFSGCRAPKLLYSIRDLVISKTDLFPESCRNMKIIKMEIPREILTERIMKRNPEITVEDVNLMLDGDLEDGLQQLSDEADIFLNNSGGIANLRTEIRRISEVNLGLKPRIDSQYLESDHGSKERWLI